jgi:hypothetical protein
MGFICEVNVLLGSGNCLVLVFPAVLDTSSFVFLANGLCIWLLKSPSTKSLSKIIL